jgi:hypothetical protein
LKKSIADGGNPAIGPDFHARFRACGFWHRALCAASRLRGGCTNVRNQVTFVPGAATKRSLQESRLLNKQGVRLREFRDRVKGRPHYSMPTRARQLIQRWQGFGKGRHIFWQMPATSTPSSASERRSPSQRHKITFLMYWKKVTVRGRAHSGSGEWPLCKVKEMDIALRVRFEGRDEKVARIANRLCQESRELNRATERRERRIAVVFQNKS